MIIGRNRFTFWGKKKLLFFLVIMLLMGGMPLPAEAAGGDTHGDYWWEDLTPSNDWPGSSSGQMGQKGQMVYDPLQDRVIALIDEGNIEVPLYNTYVWDGSEWTKLEIAEPQDWDRSLVGLLYSPKAGKVLLYAGKRNYSDPETIALWELDLEGGEWVPVSPPEGSPGPPYRYDEMAATDPSGGVVLFGGRNYTGVLGETWTWNPDTKSWSDVTDPEGKNPPARTVGSMVYDPGNGTVLLFGGKDGTNNLLGDTWLWNGSVWEEVYTVGSSPSPRYSASVAYDDRSGKIYLFGGYDGNTVLNDLWAWDGKEKRWSLVTANVEKLPPRKGALFSQGPGGQILLFGGQDPDTYAIYTDFWSYDSSAGAARTWTEIPPPSPQGRAFPAFATDERNGQVLLFGGGRVFDLISFGDTWSWDGGNWVKRSPDQPPPPRGFAAMAYDGEGILLFGGSGNVPNPDSGVLGDTWRWNGQDWEEIDPVGNNAPPARYGASMAYFPSMMKVVMFGGGPTGNAQPLGDTWLWDGETKSWSPFVDENEPSSSPPSRVFSAAAYDGKEILLFGGQTVMSPVNDTWIFNGEKWTQVMTDPEQTPPARVWGTLAYDKSTGKTFLFGGMGSDYHFFDDLWMWDADTHVWTCIDPGTPPPEQPFSMIVQPQQAQLEPAPSPRVGQLFAYSPVSRGVILFGGFNLGLWDPPTLYQDTWLLRTSDWLKLAGLTVSADKQNLKTGERTGVTGSVYGKDGLGIAGIPVTLEVYSGGGGLGEAGTVSQVVYSGSDGSYTTTYTAPDTAGSVTIKASVAERSLTGFVTLGVEKAPDDEENPPGGGENPPGGGGSPPDRTPPAETDITPPTGSITINGGADWTDTCQVTLTLTATDEGSGVKEMRFSPDGETWSEWEPYAATKLYDLTPVAGKKQVYVQLRDFAGNVSKTFADEIFSRGCCHRQPANPPQFSDIAGHWAEREIKLGATEGFVTGYPDGTFHPNREVTRAEFVVMLARAFCLPEGTKGLSFTDAGQIPGWAKDEVIRAYEAGWIEGYPDNTFRPDGKITRSEMAAIIVRALHLTANREVDLTAFNDYAEIGAWAKEYLTIAYANGLMNGRGDHRLVPNGMATRAETITLLLRALGYVEGK